MGSMVGMVSVIFIFHSFYVSAVFIILFLGVQSLVVEANRHEPENARADRQMLVTEFQMVFSRVTYNYAVQFKMVHYFNVVNTANE